MAGNISISKYIAKNLTANASADHINYGILYNWYAIANPLIAPTGGRIPTYDDFVILDNALGGLDIAGKALKANDKRWSTNTGSNMSLFTALPAGGRWPATFSAVRLTGAFGSITEDIAYPGDVFYYQVQAHLDASDINSGHKNMGLSIRFVKEDSIQTGDITDYDGNIYKTIKIGDQVGTKSNLKTEHYMDGTPIPIVSDGTTGTALTTPGICFGNNDIRNK